MITLLFYTQCQLRFLAILALRVADWYFRCLLSLFSLFLHLRERERMKTEMNREKGQCNRFCNLYEKCLLICETSAISEFL